MNFRAEIIPTVRLARIQAICQENQSEISSAVALSQVDRGGLAGMQLPSRSHFYTFHQQHTALHPLLNSQLRSSLLLMCGSQLSKLPCFCTYTKHNFLSCSNNTDMILSIIAAGKSVTPEKKCCFSLWKIEHNLPASETFFPCHSFQITTSSGKPHLSHTFLQMPQLFSQIYQYPFHFLSVCTQVILLHIYFLI